MLHPIKALRHLLILVSRRVFLLKLLHLHEHLYLLQQQTYLYPNRIQSPALELDLNLKCRYQITRPNHYLLDRCMPLMKSSNYCLMSLLFHGLRTTSPLKPIKPIQPPILLLFSYKYPLIKHYFEQIISFNFNIYNTLDKTSQKAT